MRIGALEEEAHMAKKLNADEKWQAKDFSKCSQALRQGSLFPMVHDFMKHVFSLFCPEFWLCK